MQKLFLQNQINAIHYKVSRDSPPDDKPVELRIYSSCKLVTLILFFFYELELSALTLPEWDSQSVNFIRSY